MAMLRECQLSAVFMSRSDSKDRVRNESTIKVSSKFYLTWNTALFLLLLYYQHNTDQITTQNNHFSIMQGITCIKARLYHK